MSAIYGIIPLENHALSPEHASKFYQLYSKYKIDRQEQAEVHGGFMGCGIQYFTPEARCEILPILDKETHLLFTADCVLDNREELMSQLGLTDSGIPDGTLLYQSYLRWGDDCVHHLRGMFAFAVYDSDKEEVTLCVDHFATRCLYYHVRDGILYFSTLLFPLLEASGLRYELNDRWLMDCISVCSPAMLFEPEECALDQVYKVVCGHIVHVSKNGCHKKNYWNPKNSICTDFKISDEECRKQLHTVLQQAVERSIRTDGQVAVMLSSGLDSTSVAGFAAPLLDKCNKNLYSYTSVPERGSHYKKSNYYIADESTGVKKFIQSYPNIIPTFVDCPEKNILNQGKYIVSYWELPCKSQQNAVWVSEIHRLAAENGCKIMLSGATGNCTLSGGYINNYIAYEAFHGHPIRALADINRYLKRNKIPRKRYVKYQFKQFTQYALKKLHVKKTDYYRENISRRDVGEKMNMSRHFDRDIFRPRLFKSMKKVREEIYMPNANAQIGEIDTKQSLQYGILHRDPLRDVDFITFCMKLPMHCYCNVYYERRLVREFLDDVVPDEIRLDTKHRGLQSADNAYRLCKDWNTYLPVIRKALDLPLVLQYIDPRRVQDFLCDLNADTLIEKEMDMRMVIDAYQFSTFLQLLEPYLK